MGGLWPQTHSVYSDKVYSDSRLPGPSVNMDTVRGGEGGTNERAGNTHTTIRKTTTTGNSLYDSGNPNRRSLTTQRGGKGWEVEGGSRGRGYMYTYG